MAQQGSLSGVAAVFGVMGMMKQGGVLEIELPRMDLQPTVFGTSVDIGFDTMITLLPTSSGAIAKYELVLLDAEVDPVLDSLRGQVRFLQTKAFSALHSHFLNAQPSVKYVHGTVSGDPQALAEGLRTALSHTATPFGPSMPPGDTGLDNAAIATAVGGMPEVSGTTLSVSVPRCETISQLGVVLPPPMQVATSIEFQSLGGGQAAVAGEIAVLPAEVSAVSSALRQSGLYVTALHNHELQIDPPIYCLHLFATGDPLQLATATGAAIQLTNSGCMPPTQSQHVRG